MMELDGRALRSDQQAELEAHLATCTSCRADLEIYEGLRAQASERWSAAIPPATLGKVLTGAPQRAGMRWMTLPVRTIIWIGFTLLVLFLVQWVFTHLRPSTSIQPAANPALTSSSYENTPVGIVNEAGKIPSEPLLYGEPGNNWSWSPEGDYLFIEPALYLN
jgi:predicted anti-sigma-YlaC factor YlaD